MARIRHFRHGKFVHTKQLGAHPFFVGREPISDLILEDAACSRQQFCLTEQDGGGFLLEDLESANGTFVDGIREYRKILQDNAVIQVGEDLILFEPAEDVPSEAMPQWALDTTASMGTISEDEAKQTLPVAPVLQRRVQAAGRAQTRPHLVSQLGDMMSVYPLDSQVNAIGFGPVKISLGPSKKGKVEVLAEIIHETGYDFRIRAKGLFGKIDVNGKSVSRAKLQPGDKIQIKGVDLEFRLGLQE